MEKIHGNTNITLWEYSVTTEIQLLHNMDKVFSCSSAESNEGRPFGENVIVTWRPSGWCSLVPSSFGKSSS